MGHPWTKEHLSFCLTALISWAGFRLVNFCIVSKIYCGMTGVLDKRSLDQNKKTWGFFFLIVMFTSPLAMLQYLPWDKTTFKRATGSRTRTGYQGMPKAWMLLVTAVSSFFDGGIAIGLKVRYTYWIRPNPLNEDWYAQYSLFFALIAALVCLIALVAPCMHFRPESGCQEDDDMDHRNQGTEIRTVPVAIGTPVSTQ